MTSENSTPKSNDISQTNPTEHQETWEQELQLLVQHVAQQSEEPLILFPITKSDMNGLVTQLQAINNPDEVLSIISDLEKYLSQSQVRHAALDAFIIPSWKILEALIEQAQIEYYSYNFDRYPVQLQTKIIMLIMIWEQLFRDFPNEMSHSYLSLGRQINPLKHAYFNRFIRRVSKKLGRDVNSIVYEQIPSLE